MKVKELFKFIDTTSCLDIIIHSISGKVSTFKYPQDDRTYIEGMLNQFGDEEIEPNGIIFGSDEYDIDYIIIQVK